MSYPVSGLPAAELTTRLASLDQSRAERAEGTRAAIAQACPDAHQPRRELAVANGDLHIHGRWPGTREVIRGPRGDIQGLRLATGADQPSARM